MPLLIDGHNLLHTIQKVFEDFKSFSDIQLCSIIDRFLRLTSEKGLLVLE